MRKDRGEEEICLISWRLYLSFRSINVFLNLTFFLPFSRYIPVQDLVLFFASISYPPLLHPPPLPPIAIFAFVFRSFCSFHLFVDISFFSPPYLCTPFSSVRYSFSFCRYLRRRRSFWVSFSLAICSPLFKVGR